MENQSGNISIVGPMKETIVDTEATLGNKHDIQNNENNIPKIPKLGEVNSKDDDENGGKDEEGEVGEEVEQEEEEEEGEEEEEDEAFDNVDDDSSEEGIPPVYDNVIDAKQEDLYGEQLHPKVYDFSTAICVKTSDRILDDLRSDPLFLLRGDDGILSQATIRYSHELSKMAKSSNTKYQPVFWNTQDINNSSMTSMELDDGSTLVKFSGLLTPIDQSSNSSSDPVFLNSQIFHYLITVKYKKDRVKVKNSFYGFLDDQLFEEDKIWIEPEDIVDAICTDDTNSAKTTDILLKSLPTLLDAATFISKETNTLVRIEVYPAIFSKIELESFTLTEIQTRIATYNSQLPQNEAFNQINLSSHECFLKLKNALMGPAKHKNSQELKTINLKSTKLEVMVDLSILTDKFFFTIMGDDGSKHLNPIQLSSLGEYSFVCEDYFRRAVQEVMYYTALSSPNSNDVSNLFSHSFNDVFLSINEFDSEKQIRSWSCWNDQNYSDPMILLSICPYYNDQLICHIYELLTTFDSDNIPLYFDALTYCTTSRFSNELNYYVSILQGRGLLGFGELKSFFTKLGFSNVSSCNKMNQITDEQLLNAYQNQLIVAPTKYEKVTFRDMLDKIAIFRNSNLLSEYLNTEPYFDIYDAYKMLDIDPSLDDTLLITFYDYKVSENGRNFDPNVARAFYTIVLARKSIILMSYIDTNLPQFSVPNISLHDSYQFIGCLETADDLMIVRIFQERLNKDVTIDFRILWKSLKTIGDRRRSKLIEGYLASGIVDSTLLGNDQSPAGLNNIGNTCYLNSLLQYYFVIEPLRTYILEFNEIFNAEEFQKDENYQVRRVGGRTVGLKETERSYQFMYQLRDLYYQLIHENDKCVTPSRELAYLAFSPISFEVEFENNNQEPEKEKNENLITTALEDASATKLLQDIEGEFKPGKENEVINYEDVIDLTTLSDEDKNFNDNKTKSGSYDIEQSTSDESTGSNGQEFNKDIDVQTVKKMNTAAVCKISADQFESAFEIGSQQDVTECISNVLTQIESAMKPDIFEENNEQIDMIKALFYGKTKQRLVPVDNKTKEEIPNANVRTKVESFLNLIVNIGDHPKDIYDALDTFFTEDLLELEDGEVKRSLTIIELPNILQIQIQRVQFDRERFIPVKSTEPIPFEEKLYMDRYLETEDQVIIHKRKDIFHWRRRVQELNAEKENILSTNEQGMSIRDVLKSTRNFLSSDAMKGLDIPVDMNTLEVLDLEINRLDKLLLNINNELDILHNNINQQFKGFTKVGYSVFAIFIHRGQASYGHYFIYIRDPKSNVYRKYNDEHVSEVPLEEVFNFSDGNTATPYYLSFIKDELLDKITPLQRDIFVNNRVQELNEMNATSECPSTTYTSNGDDFLGMDID